MLLVKIASVRMNLPPVRCHSLIHWVEAHLTAHLLSLCPL